MLRRVLYFALALFAAYALLVAAVWWQQDRLVFPGAGRGERPIEAPGVRTSSLARAGGGTFRLAEASPAAPPNAVLLFFVGNGEDLRSAAWHVAALAEYGVHAIAPEYPGYGASQGAPGVDSILATADAAAAHAEAAARRLGVPLFVGGSSLGTFCAVHVAAQGKAQRCLLRAPPTSMADAASQRFWWLPVGLLLRSRFDNESLAPSVRCPVLIVHGDCDAIVPLQLGERLRTRFAGTAELVVAAGFGHNDLSLGRDGPVAARVAAFLAAP